MQTYNATNGLNMRGYYGIGIVQNKTIYNLGTLWRSAYIFGARFVFTIGRRYKRSPTDTYASTKHIPLYNYDSLDEMYKHLPHACVLVGVELDEKAKDIATYSHPERAIYLLGAEDNGLSQDMISKCHDLIVLPGDRSINVAVAGSIVMYDRVVKRKEY